MNRGKVTEALERIAVARDERAFTATDERERADAVGAANRSPRGQHQRARIPDSCW
jgi:hypothetical protein